MKTKQRNSFLGMDDESGEVFMECCVYILEQGNFVMRLGAGMSSVLEFSKLADAGIPGSIETKRGWYCNRDVQIKGESLLEFIEKMYPECLGEAKAKIKKRRTYLIVADDYS